MTITAAHVNYVLSDDFDASLLYDELGITEFWAVIFLAETHKVLVSLKGIGFISTALRIERLVLNGEWQQTLIMFSHCMNIFTSQEHIQPVKAAKGIDWTIKAAQSLGNFVGQVRKEV